MHINRKWTKTRILAEALKYTSRNAFKKGSVNAYMAAQRDKILDEVCAHMSPAYESLKNLLTEKDVREKALTCANRLHFRLKERAHFNKARELRIIDELFPARKSLNTYTQWTKEIIQELALKYDNLDDFEGLHKGAYNFAQRNNFLAEVTRHMPPRYKLLTPKERLKVIKANIKLCQTRTEFLSRHPLDYNYLREHEQTLLLTKAFGPSFQERDEVWTNKKIQAEALKYTSRKAFHTHSRAAASIARTRGIHEEVCAHMPRNSEQREMKLQEELVDCLHSILEGQSYEIKEQHYLNIEGEAIYLDVVITLNDFHYVLELKHDESSWTKKDINDQLSKYQRLLKPQDNWKEVKLVSKDGKYGMSLNDCLQWVLSLLS